ncbi:TPA: hypothetical protein IUT89_002652 [Enterococcus faecalis]|uniref:hypothetical protein n=1 Tax=Enterococcus TaxID=1350 RepID=UPI000331102D|nr:hypothetical protein [Enterococcus faecalis]EGO2585338.1 hypothetical protein [Enterococcus faecalis]EGO2815802.1 hypothetical protein [Enterococcus faecalis]EGO8059528.1 hypothetical protein [Enterococcus faecalis]EGO8127635.1 hypothetical protein [Enterococcus faecalis]EGO8461641.1 hypothetical protein [Enterococcus faecalis]
MTIKNKEMKYVIAQILLVNPSSECPKIHPKRTTIKRGQLIKRLELLVQSYEEKGIELDLEPYKKTIQCLRKMSDKENYQTLIDEIVLSYELLYEDQKKEKIKEENTRISQKKSKKKEKQLPEKQEKIEDNISPVGFFSSIKNKLKI